uniref:Uncharacterized protein n=1 Tax=Anguilla anguilla TaxID=7936 RepID=A0A0E9P5N1_ANGAN
MPVSARIAVHTERVLKYK